MPIVAKSVIEARRAAAAAAAAPQTKPVLSGQSALSNTGQQVIPASGDHPAIGADLSSAAQPAKRRGHAVKNENGKWQPTADYPEGFARPPVRTQFKPGCKGGPGRPKGSASHDALLAKHLHLQRDVSLNGRRQKLTARELLIMTTVKSALEGKDKQARAYVLAHDQRLHPSKENGTDAMDAPALTASDMLSLAEYEEELRERIRAEVRAELVAKKGEEQ